MLECDLHFGGRIFTAADPSCCRFGGAHLRPEPQALPLPPAALALWWSVHARVAPSATNLGVWSALEGLVPEPCDSWRPPNRDALHAARAPDHGTGAEGAVAVPAWPAQLDNVYAPLLHVSHSKLQGLSLTAQTGCALRLKLAKVPLKTAASPDGLRSPNTPEDFQAELLRQA